MLSVRLFVVAAVVLMAQALWTPAKSEISADNVTASLSCPPGFVPQGNCCVCANWPNGIVICDEVSQRASMQIGYCMTYDSYTGEVRAGICEQSFLRNDSYKFYYSLPSDVSDLNDQMCGPFKKAGLLCGRCQYGLSVTPLTKFSCINCTAVTFRGWIEYLSVLYIPITVIFMVIIMFAINITSGPVNSFIFFGQVTATQFFNVGYIASVLEAQTAAGTYSSRTSTTLIAAIYDIWNLNVFTTFVPPFCLTKYLSVLQAFALEYIIAFYPLFLVVLLYICIKLHARDFRPIVCCWKPFLECFLRFRRRVDPRTSAIDAFATFMILSYVKLLYVSESTLLPTYPLNGQGEELSTAYVYFSTHIRYFSTKHLPLALLSIFVALTFIAIPPIVLMFYPASLFQRCLTRCKMNSQALRTFVEIFQGCYKDGTKGTRDCRYFAGLYFILRITAVVLSSGYYHVFIHGSALLYWTTALLFAVIQPYKTQIYNVIDAVMFGLMGTMYFLITCNIEYIMFTGRSSNPLLILTDVLYSLPLLYLVVFILYRILSRENSCTQKLKNNRDLCYFFHEPQEDCDTAIPHRLLNSGEYETLNDEDRVDYEELLRAEHSRKTYDSM